MTELQGWILIIMIGTFWAGSIIEIIKDRIFGL